MPSQPYHSRLAGWGRFPVVDGLVLKSENLAAISAAATLSRGLGRSYGDSSLPARPELPGGRDDVGRSAAGLRSGVGVVAGRGRRVAVGI